MVWFSSYLLFIIGVLLAIFLFFPLVIYLIYFRSSGSFFDFWTKIFLFKKHSS